MNFIKIFALLLFAFSANAQTKKVKTIKYETATRGFQEKIMINKDKVHLVRISPQGKVDTTFTLSQRDWNQLNKIVKGINLKNIAVVKSPTEYSQTDRAMASSITIDTEVDSYTSSQFDNRNAPKELTTLMKKISCYIDKVPQ